MRYRGIIITGTNGSSMSAIAATICERDERFRFAGVVTTRHAYPDDPPETHTYVSKEEFSTFRADGDLALHWTYGEFDYGILKSTFERSEAKRTRPIICIHPEAAFDIDSVQVDEVSKSLTKLPKFMSVFLDATDEHLDKLWLEGIQENRDLLKEVLKQRERDRQYKDRFVYTIENRDFESTVQLVIAFWDSATSGGVLTARLIRLMLQCGTLLEGASLNNVSGASYDLALGDEYFYGGKIRRLSESEPILTIEPYDYAIVTSREIAHFPRDVCARFDLAVSLFCQGIILSNGPQVDPGFRGPLFCLLFNTSSRLVLLKWKHHYATLEFHKLVEPTYSYKGQYQARTLLSYLPSNAAQGAINELKKELEKFREQSRKLQDTTWAVLALILALLAVVVSLK